jgi:hypothetical protein
VALAEFLLAVAAPYGLLGLVVGVPFVLWGAGRVDPAARGTGPGFRLLILPGAAALWPLLAWKWWRAIGTEGVP